MDKKEKHTSFVAGMVPPRLRKALEDEAKKNYRTLSQQLRLILDEHYKRNK